MNDGTEKLYRGLRLLATAGEDRVIVGYALICIHGALEDRFRAWLAANPDVPSEERAAVIDRRRVQWEGLLNMMRTYGDLHDGAVQTIRRMNDARQRVAHGDELKGTRQDVEKYAVFVKRLMGIPDTAEPSVRTPVVPHLWKGMDVPTVSWRSWSGAFLLLVVADVVYDLALSTLRWQTPLDMVGWGCLVVAIILLVVGVGILLKAMVQLGIRRLLIYGSIMYLTAVVITGAITPADRRDIDHWFTSALTVADATASGVGRLFYGLVASPSNVQLAALEERRPVFLSGVVRGENVPTATLSVDRSVAPTESAKTQATSIAPASAPSPTPPDRPLQPGDRVQVSGTGGVALRIRIAPSAASRVVARLPEGSGLEIIDGPEQADGRTWWKVRGAFGEGWCAADYLVRQQ
ncbi:SH3 domain-containing protein [Roseiflexus sp.]|uniref:SH3 domain-containing protein n=1 Tax=Roseiflexus sp. TaxID=2562120 RepID=UPI00398B8882